MSNLDASTISRIPNKHEYYFNFDKVTPDVFHSDLKNLKDNLISHDVVSCYDYGKGVIKHHLVSPIYFQHFDND